MKINCWREKIYLTHENGNEASLEVAKSGEEWRLEVAHLDADFFYESLEDALFYAAAILFRED